MIEWHTGRDDVKYDDKTPCYFVLLSDCGVVSAVGATGVIAFDKIFK